MNLFFLVAVYYIPESPNYLMSRGREKEAEKVLNLLDIDLSVLATISCEQKNAKIANETLLDQIKKAANLKPLVCGMILMAFFQGMDVLKIIRSFDSNNYIPNF